MSRDGRETLLEAMRQKLRSEDGKQIYKKRGYTAEKVFRQSGMIEFVTAIMYYILEYNSGKRLTNFFIN